jgi:hypothetical protein
MEVMFILLNVGYKGFSKTLEKLLENIYNFAD